MVLTVGFQGGGCSGTRRVSSPPHMPICDGECSVYGPHSCQQCPVHHSQHHRTLVCIFHPSSNSKGSSTNSNPRQLGNVCRLWSLGTQGISSSFLTVVKSWQFEASFCLKLLDAVRALLGIWEAWRGVLAVGEMMVRWRLSSFQWTVELPLISPFPAGPVPSPFAPSSPSSARHIQTSQNKSAPAFLLAWSD
jgi:hypothetical protein